MDDLDGAVRDLRLLEEIERDPDTTQAGLAKRLGVAVGTVNWHLKRFVAKGYVKVKRAERRKLKYIITPEGIALRAKLTMLYIENSMQLYRQTRRQAQKVLQEARAQGLEGVVIDGDGDIADVCRLTSLEVGMPVVEEASDDSVGVIEIHGRSLKLKEAQV